MKKANIAAAFTGMGFSAAAFIKTLSFKQFKNVPVGPEFFPRWLAAGLFVCSGALLVQALGMRPGESPPAPTLSPLDRGMRRLFAGAGIIVLYALLWEVLGFLIVTPLAVFALMFLLGLRKFPLMISFSLGAALVIFGAFRFLLGIDMPVGIMESLF
jgi:putative tricarboxylic transport membrane protein